MKIIEVGHNHMGSAKLGLSLIDQVCQTSCDAVTVQVREQRFYDENSKFNVPYHFYHDASQKIKMKGKKFGVALSNLDMFNFFDNLSPDFYKVLSKDLENSDFLKLLRVKTNKKIFLSTGMSSYEKIDDALKLLGENVTLIHTAMSDDLEDVNLRAIMSMRKRFNVDIAYGNHCKNLNAVYAAIAFQPSAVFLYSKGVKSLSYPDNVHAVSVNQLENFLENINQIEKTIGDGVKYKITKGIKGQK